MADLPFRGILTIMPDYMVGVPLWDEEGAQTEGDEFGLSAETLAKLRAVQHLWDSAVELSGPVDWVLYRQVGEDARKAVQEEVGSSITVVLWLPPDV